MSISRRVAKPLCTAQEYKLVDDSFAPEVNALSRSELQQRVQRARRNRDKYRDLAEKQEREQLGRAAPTSKRPAQGNRNTVTKQQLFDETLIRYQKCLEKAQAVEARKKAVESAKKALVRKKAAKTAGQKQVKADKTAGKGVKKNKRTKTQQFPNLPTMRGATRAANARSQARRDSRR